MNKELPFHVLSKSTFTKGLQCEKSLYLNKYNPELKDEIPASREQVFRTGHEVGELAQQLFTGGVDCGFGVTNSGQKSVELTASAIREGKDVIYEAAFQFEGVLVIADIMTKNENKWKVYEVKSSTKIEEYQINDTAIQYFVISKCGIDIDDISIVYINNQYVRQGEIDVQQLFTIESVKEQVVPIQDFVDTNITRFKEVLAGKNIPEIDIGEQCDYPFECEFKGHCWKHIPEYSLFDLSRISKKAFELYRNGITEIKDIPNDFPLTTAQAIERECFLQNKNYIDRNEIKSFLDGLSYPMYFMDFETIQYAVPMFDNSRPYQQIGFQYSMFRKDSREGDAVHYEFLGDGKSDPRREFIENLLRDAGNKGTILVYNASFEIQRLKEIARDFPEYEEGVNKMLPRIADLMVPFRNKSYYKPEMKGGYSIKKVLPAINPDYTYENLEIQEGSAAGMEYLRMSSLSDEEEKSKIRKNLLEYCKRDTWGMAVILEELMIESTTELSNKMY
ncbi:MAG: DUF2779 domain-containing protein [Ignavibacteria bacterium]